GMRIVIELKRDSYPQVVLNNLYKQTPIQTNFGANMLALVSSDPQLLSLKKFLTVFLDFREEAIIRRTRYKLRKAQERDHLLQGLLIALENLDAVIELIRHSEDAAVAKAELMSRYELSASQSDAILQMQLRRLTALEAEKIQREHEDLLEQIADLEDILNRRERRLDIIETEVTQIKDKFATPRRTVIEFVAGDINEMDLIANEQSVVLVTEQGYMKRMPVSAFEAQNRATRGRAGAKMKQDDAIEHFFACCDHDSILFFSDRGVVYSLKAYQIPMGSRIARGVPVVQLLPIPREEQITTVMAVSEFTDEEFLVMMTGSGYIKKTALSAFSNIRTNGLIAIALEDGDALRWVRRARVEDTVLIGTELGMAIHFRADHEQLRPLGRATRGVRAMKLKDGDCLVGMDVIAGAVTADLGDDDDAEGDEVETDLVEETGGPWVLVITTYGYGKRVPVSQFRLQKRAGKGVTSTKFKKLKRTDTVTSLRIVHPDDELMIITNRGIIIRQSVNAISSQSRSATGVRVQRLDADDFISAVTLVPPSEGDEDMADDLEGETNEAAAE
ncbi:MAG: DNA gyrase C-terminal beta-propeller domain-containing protein, partial [Cyanobacteria bacterium P01_F01_bin.42]